jgi:CelD/BcsL family acetyltransferase involved in cellulose biosynthesis
MPEARAIPQAERFIKQATIIDLLPSSAQTEAAHRWQDLEQQIGNTGLTNSWLWVKTWLDHYEDTVHPTFAFGIQDGQPIGAALITESIHSIRGIPIPVVYLGTAGEPEQESAYVEYNRLLVAPQHLDAFALKLILTLQQQFRWSELRLAGFVPQHADALMRAGAYAGLLFRGERRASPAFVLQQAAKEGDPDLLSALGKNTRYRIRHSMRLFERTFGPQRIEWAETPGQAKAILKELVQLHQQRWQRVGYLGAFHSERKRCYHEGLIDRLALWPQGSVIVMRAIYGETTIGCLFHLVDEGRHMLFYKCGFALLEDKKLTPGLVTHALCMVECQRRGLVTYDFLAGEGQYKAELSNTEQSLIWATAQRGLRSWLIEKARLSFRLGKELLRRVPTSGISQ